MSTDQPPITIGRVVHYCMSESDCSMVKQQRLLNGQTSNGGVLGNSPHPGDILAAIAVRVWSNNDANLKVLLDGPDTYWVTSRVIDVTDGAEPSPGSWRWPTRT